MAITRAEQDVEMASDLYEARRAAKFLLGASYSETLKPYQHFIARVMFEERLPVLRAALKIGQSIPPSDGIPLMCVLAAAVEMMESQARGVDGGYSDNPSPTTPANHKEQSIASAPRGGGETRPQLEHEEHDARLGDVPRVGSPATASTNEPE